MTRFKTFQLASVALAVSQVVSFSSLAATIEVTTTNDFSEPSECSLRDAIIASETDAIVAGCPAGSGSDFIELSNLADNSTIILSSELPTIESSVTINGNGQDSLLISGNNQTKIFNISAGGELNLNSLSLTQGYTFLTGAAINMTSASLSLDSVAIFENNTMFSGGGINAINSSINILNSNLENNSTAHYGGAMNSTDSDIVIKSSTISGNSVIGPNTLFGAIYSGGALRLKNDTLEVTDSILSANSSLLNGGAIGSYFSSISIENCDLSQNNSRDGAGIYSDGGTININRTALSKNNAGAIGGGIFTNRAFLNIKNSTLSENSAGINGGGINSSFSTITIDHTTVTGNIADNVGSGLLTRDLSVVINNSIVAGNALGARDGAEIHNQSGTIPAQNNIFGFNELTNSSAFFGFTPDSNNIVATSDELNLPLNQIINPLANNGGDNLTHSLPDNSPAFNASNNINCPVTDQRGEPRDDGQCDVGAFEGDSGLVLNDSIFFVIPSANGQIIIVEL